jgi:hypothetical protein
MCGCFGNMPTCIYCVLFCFVLFCLYMVTGEQEMMVKETVYGWDIILAFDRRHRRKPSENSVAPVTIRTENHPDTRQDVHLQRRLGRFHNSWGNIAYHSTLYKPPQSKQRLHKRSISSGYVWRQVVITITPTLISILSVTFQQRASAPLGINYTFVLVGASCSLAQIFFQSDLSHRMKMMRDGLAVEIQRSLKIQHKFHSTSSLLNAEVWVQHTAASNSLKPNGN